MRRWFQIVAVTCVGLALAETLWACEASDDTDYLTSVERAKQLDRPLILAFLGTDWSMTSLKLDREVFDQPAFADDVTYPFLLCKIHFYQNQERLPEIIEQNRGLAEKYGIEKFPTVVVLSPQGAEIGRFGYVEGGVEKFGAAVAAVLHR
jgi:thioredoxin-related protein